MNIRAVVLAAGEGQRMKSLLPKVVHPLCGRPMLGYILEAAASVSEEVLVVVGRKAQVVKETMGPEWSYIIQESQLGTGHALSQALPELPDQGLVIVLCGDSPLLTGEDLEQLISQHGSSAVTVMTAVVPGPGGYGRVIRDSSGLVEKIVEERDASAREKDISEINTGTYCFDLPLLKNYLPRLSSNNVQGEYYLTDIIAMLKAEGHIVSAYQSKDYRVALGVNDRSQLAEAAAILRRRINDRLMRQGVTIVDPDNTYIDYDVKINTDTTVWPMTLIQGSTTIGLKCQVGPGTQIIDSKLGNGVTVSYSVVKNSILKPGSFHGPFASLQCEGR